MCVCVGEARKGRKGGMSLPTLMHNRAVGSGTHSLSALRRNHFPQTAQNDNHFKRTMQRNVPDTGQEPF